MKQTNEKARKSVKLATLLALAITGNLMDGEYAFKLLKETMSPEDFHTFCKEYTFQTYGQQTSKQKDLVVTVDVLNNGLAKNLIEIVAKAKSLAQKFVGKVESGKAKSKETYADCKELLEHISKLPEKK